jgi:predicted acyl esterase
VTTSEMRPEAGPSEQRHGIQIDWDVPIVMDDGVVIRADVFRPIGAYPVPALVSYGPYGKGLRFSEHHTDQWNRLISSHPEVIEGSSGDFQAWETVDPEKWVPFGYACVRVDSRGAGRSVGFLDPHSPREILDTYSCVEWAGTQPWSNGKVGMLGLSYYATNGWLVAALPDPPPHLAAVCAWEGSGDSYRDSGRHGGILSPWVKNWWASRILPLQHGYGERGPRSPNTGELVAGPETLSDEELAANRADTVGNRMSHILDDEWTKSRSVRWENISVPVLSAANWGGAGLHLRGNVEGFVRATTEDKWLEVHTLEHWTHFYSDYGLDVQRRFMDRFLKGDDAGWKDQPRVSLNVRSPGEVVTLRGEAAWPIPDTKWTRRYLAPSGTLADAPSPGDAIPFEALGDGLRFVTDPLTDETEITGPVAAKLYVSSSTADADLFLVLHVFDPDGREVTFQGAMDPLSTVGKGWLRASHRKLDPDRSTEYQPYHTHDLIEPLVPDDIYELDVEVWPTSIVVPAGYRIGLSILGRDYFHEAPDGSANFDNFGASVPRNGSGGFLHNDPDDRPAEIFGGNTTVHIGPEHPSHVLLPVIPKRA